MRRCLFALLFLLNLISLARAEQVDLKLVLALDASSSVDEKEYQLQLRGVANALRDPAVQTAMVSGPARKIAIDVIIWAQPSGEKQQTGWVPLASPQDAERIAARIERMPRWQEGGTGIGEGVMAGLVAIRSSPFTSYRNVIDVSGDGRETPEYTAKSTVLSQAHKYADAMGVIINGLAITGDNLELLTYYLEDVRHGPQSFAMAADDYEDFARAMKRKLLREIQSQPVALLPDD